MTWFRVDDSFPSHPKVLAIPRGATRMRAVGLWTALGAWCAQQLTDGRFGRHMVAEQGGTPADARQLVEVGLWEVTSDGYAFHDWADWQPTRAQVEADREAARARMRTARNKRRSSPEHTPNFGGSSPEVAVTPTRPDPTRPVSLVVTEVCEQIAQSQNDTAVMREEPTDWSWK